MRIIQLVPQLDASRCGVAAYAEALGVEWQNGAGVESFYLAIRGADNGAAQVLTGSAFAKGAAFFEGLTRLCISREGCGGVVLHFSGYGYAKRGAPVWLESGMRKFRRQHPTVGVVTMFHELFATGPVYSSAFWLSWFQKRVAARLAAISDVVFTNRQASANWLTQQKPELRDQIVVLPVFSNMGEPTEVTAPSKRQNRLVMFGYQAKGCEDRSSIHQAVEILRPEVITILGRDGAEAIGAVPAGVRLEQLGWLPPDQISQVLSESRFGWISYAPAYLGKSGIFAAYLAHGVVPVLVGGGDLSEGLQEGRHVLFVNKLQAEALPADTDAMSHEGRQWYNSHDRHETAGRFLRVLKSLSSGGNGDAPCASRTY